MHTHQTFVTWDLGGTKCSVALIEHDLVYDRFNLLKQSTHKLSEFRSLHELVDCFEADLNMKMLSAQGILISAAGQYDGENLHLANPYPFPMSIATLARKKQWSRFHVVHDYVPVICTTFIAARNDQIHYRILKDGDPSRHGRRVAFGIGTGLGMKDGVLLPNGDFWLGSNEIGHIGITAPPDSSQTAIHQEFMQFLLKKGFANTNQPLTFESILSGAGFARIHEFFSGEALTPEAAAEAAQNQKNHPTLSLFAWYLGLLTGTVQLAFMPDAGLWITGGVINKQLGVFDQPSFHEGIVASPAYLEEREKMPLYVLTGDFYATIGAAYFASRHFRGQAYAPRLATNLQVV